MRIACALACGIALASTAAASGPKWVPLISIKPGTVNETRGSAPGQQPSAPTASLEDAEASVSRLLDRAERSDLDRDQTDKISNLALTLWFVCIGHNELRLHNSKDEVATIATAVLGSCMTDEQIYTIGQAVLS